MRLNSLMRSIPPVWLLVLLALTLWGGEFARRGLWAPDEARYAYVAQEMRDGGHWFVPHINGEPYPDKPPLMFWLINASSLLTGGRINGVSARLPSLLGSILTLWVMTRLLARWHGTEAAWRAMLILPTSFLFWQEGGWGRIDALLCGLVMLSLYFFFTSLEDNRTRREVLAYVFAGLAVFAKGPIGLALPMGIFLASALAGDSKRKLQRTHWLWGPLIALAIPAIWLLVAWLQNAPPEYFAAMFGEKSFGRVIKDSGHERPFYYFLLHFPLGLLPWTVFLPAAFRAGTGRALRRMLLAWIGVVIVLFSLFVCKRHIYILSAYPAAAMFIAVAWERFPRLPRPWITGTGVAALGLICMLAAAVTVSLFVPQIPFNRLLLAPGAFVLLTGSALLVPLFRREDLSHRWFATFAGVMLLFQISVTAIVLPGLNKLKGPVDAAEAVKAIVPPDQPVYLYRQQLAIFPLYAERQGREIHSIEALHSVLSERDYTVVVFNETKWKEIGPQFEGTVVVHPFTSGNKQLVWVKFSH